MFEAFFGFAIGNELGFDFSEDQIDSIRLQFVCCGAAKVFQFLSFALKNNFPTYDLL